jgi:hypothetical protein
VPMVLRRTVTSGGALMDEGHGITGRDG